MATLLGVAGGDIYPHRFVMVSTAADHKYLQCTAGLMPAGVSQRPTRKLPLDGYEDTRAAIADGHIHVYGAGETCILECGGTITPGSYLKSDGDGKAVVASAGDKYGALTNMSGTSGKLIQVVIQMGELET